MADIIEQKEAINMMHNTYKYIICVTIDSNCFSIQLCSNSFCLQVEQSVILYCYYHK